MREDYRAVKAVEEAQGFINRLREEAARPWRSPATGAGQPTSLPADQVISLAALAAQHNAEFAVTPVTSELVTRQVGDHGHVVAAQIGRQATVDVVWHDGVGSGSREHAHPRLDGGAQGDGVELVELVTVERRLLGLDDDVAVALTAVVDVGAGVAGGAHAAHLDALLVDERT